MEQLGALAREDRGDLDYGVLSHLIMAGSNIDKMDRHLKCLYTSVVTEAMILEGKATHEHFIDCHRALSHYHSEQDEGFSSGGPPATSGLSSGPH